MNLTYPRFRHLDARVSQVLAGAIALGAASAAYIAARLGFYILIPSLAAIVLTELWAVARAKRAAERAKVGADSEATIVAHLAPLVADGWSVRHNLPCPDGDIDHVAISPRGTAFAIETKTQTVTSEHLVRARWAASFIQQRLGTPQPVIAVITTARRNNCTGWHDGVLVVSGGHLTLALRQIDGH